MRPSNELYSILPALFTGKVGLIFTMDNKSALILCIYYLYFISRDFFLHSLRIPFPINTNISVTRPVKLSKRAPLFGNTEGGRYLHN